MRHLNTSSPKTFRPRVLVCVNQQRNLSIQFSSCRTLSLTWTVPVLDTIAMTSQSTWTLGQSFTITLVGPGVANVHERGVHRSTGICVKFLAIFWSFISSWNGACSLLTMTPMIMSSQKFRKSKIEFSLQFKLHNISSNSSLVRNQFVGGNPNMILTLMWQTYGRSLSRAAESKCRALALYFFPCKSIICF